MSTGYCDETEPRRSPAWPRANRAQARLCRAVLRHHPARGHEQLPVLVLQSLALPCSGAWLHLRLRRNFPDQAPDGLFSLPILPSSMLVVSSFV